MNDRHLESLHNPLGANRFLQKGRDFEDYRELSCHGESLGRTFNIRQVFKLHEQVGELGLRELQFLADNYDVCHCEWLDSASFFFFASALFALGRQSTFYFCSFPSSNRKLL